MKKHDECTKMLKTYAKVVDERDKIKYDPAEEEKYLEEIKALDEKHEADFRGKANAIRDGIMGKLAAEYWGKTELLKKGKPVLVEKFRAERITSTDIDKYGKDGILLSLKKVIAELIATTKGNDIANADNNTSKNVHDNKENELEADAESDKNRIKEEFEKKDKKSKKAILKTARGDTYNIAITIGQQKDGEIDLYEKNLRTNYETFKAEIEANAKLEGEALGAEDVRIINEEIMSQAKIIVAAQNEVKAKIKIVKETAKHKAKLIAASMFGGKVLKVVNKAIDKA